MWRLYAAKLAHARRSSGGFAKKTGPQPAGAQRVEKLDTLHKGKQPRTAIA